MTIRTRHLIILLDRLGNKTADDDTTVILNFTRQRHAS